MNKSITKDPRKTPILGIIVESPRCHSSGVFAAIKVGFRYWGETNRLEYYGDYDYEATKFALGNFYLKQITDGDHPERGDEEQYSPSIRYENVYSLENEDQVKAMSKTLTFFKSKLRPMHCKEPRPCFAQYVEEAARLLKIKEAVIDDGSQKLSLAEALEYISDTSWKLRQRCLCLENNLSSIDYAKKWCDRNGYSDLQRPEGYFWAIPPGQFRPICIESSLRV